MRAASWCFAALFLSSITGCKAYDPLFCDANNVCTDPDRPFCDLEGTHPASEGIAKTCIPEPFEGVDASTAVDAAPSGHDECEPDSSTCTAGVESRCGPDGRLEDDRTCRLGCDETSTRCMEVVASNELARFLEDADLAPALELLEGDIIDTDTGVIVRKGEPVAVPSELVEAPDDGVDVRVFIVSSLTISGETLVIGESAIAVVADGEIAIRAHLLINGRGVVPGPGAGPTGQGGAGRSSGIGTNAQHTGGGGGGFGSPGGQGGGAGLSPNGGAGGSLVGSARLVPLRGGGNGGTHESSPGGGAGGAVQLVSRTAITITDSGVINAGGANGGSTVFSEGGGSGGGILLEAPTVIVSGAETALAANGGGGGCAGAVTLDPEDGRLDSQRASGCESNNTGDGGDGAAGTQGASPGAPPPGGSGSSTGGGGGGGVGRIRVNTASASFAPLNGAVVSPPASVARLPVE
jgi:hypothetical protein